MEPELVGQTWAVERLLDGGHRYPVPDGIEAELRFGDGRVAVRAGCNRGSAPFALDSDAGTVAFGPMAVTRMMCGPEAMRVEEHVLAVLDGTVSVAWEDDCLVLEHKERGLVLRARTAP